MLARYRAITEAVFIAGFLHFIPFPPPAGIAGQFIAALYVSHYLWVIFAFQLIAGALLLVNRHVPLFIWGQRPFVQQGFQHAEIREAESGLFHTGGCISCPGAHRLHHY